MLDSDWKVLFRVGSVQVGPVFVEHNTNSAQLELGLWLSLAVNERDLCAQWLTIGIIEIMTEGKYPTCYCSLCVVVIHSFNNPMSHLRLVLLIGN